MLKAIILPTTVNASIIPKNIRKRGVHTAEMLVAPLSCGVLAAGDNWLAGGKLTGTVAGCAGTGLMLLMGACAGVGEGNDGLY